MVSKDSPHASPNPGRDFAHQSTGGKVLGAIVAPAALGAISGVLLGVSAVGYWLLQVVAVGGGFLGGTEHPGWRPGIVRGIVGGAVYGAVILLVRGLTGWSDEIDLGEVPGFLVVITTVIGAALGALGGAVRAHRG